MLPCLQVGGLKVHTTTLKAGVLTKAALLKSQWYLDTDNKPLLLFRNIDFSGGMILLK